LQLKQPSLAWFILKVPMHARTLYRSSLCKLRQRVLNGPRALMQRVFNGFLGLGKMGGSRQGAPHGFTVLEAVFASAILAIGLSGVFQLSAASMAANQSQRNLVFASGLAQNLAECWQVNTAICLSQFQASQQADALSNGAGVQFERSWLITSISTPSKDPQLLQNLQISVKWPHQDKIGSSVELHWHIRRASTPTWVGL
jgi:hypothetical protein